MPHCKVVYHSNGNCGTGQERSPTVNQFPIWSLFTAFFVALANIVPSSTEHYDKSSRPTNLYVTARIDLDTRDPRPRPPVDCLQETSIGCVDLPTLVLVVTPRALAMHFGPIASLCSATRVCVSV